MGKTYYVYILVPERNGTLYVGLSNVLVQRMFAHKDGLVEGFTKTYGAKRSLKRRLMVQAVCL